MQYQQTYDFEIFGENIRTVVVEEGVERIERFRLSSLKRVEIHDSMTKLNCSAFTACRGLTEVVILYVPGALVGNLLIVIAVVIIVKKLRKRRG